MSALNQTRSHPSGIRIRGRYDLPAVPPELIQTAREWAAAVRDGGPWPVYLESRLAAALRRYGSFTDGDTRYWLDGAGEVRREKHWDALHQHHNLPGVGRKPKVYAPETPGIRVVTVRNPRRWEPAKR